MTGAAPLTYPGSQALGDWWTQLQPFRPRALWIAHLNLHRIEALARVKRGTAVRRLPHLILNALGLEPVQSVLQLERRLGLGTQIVGLILRDLANKRLVSQDESGQWSLTSDGSRARDRREYLEGELERRTFFFVETNRSDGVHFLGLTPGAIRSWAHTHIRSFDLQSLRSCLARPETWKNDFGFPLDVEGILEVDEASIESSSRTGAMSWPAEPVVEAWQRVVVDSPGRILVALTLQDSAGKSDSLIGFSVDPKGWTVAVDRPLFRFTADWRETFPWVTSDPSIESWRQAWRAWGQSMAFSAGELDTCALERRDHRLIVRCPPGVFHRLEESRNAALRDKAWIMAGEDPWRVAAVLDVQSEETLAG